MKMLKSPAFWIKIVIVALGLYMLHQVSTIYLPIIVATVVAFVLNPLVNKVASIPLFPYKSCLPRGAAILIVFILTGLTLVVITSFVLLPFVNEFNNFVINMPKLAARIRSLTMLIAERANAAQVPANVRLLIENTLTEAASYAVSLVRNAINTVFSFASQIIELVVVPVLAYYFLKDWKNIKADVVTLFPPSVRTSVVSVIEEMAIVVSNYIRGQVLISVIMGLMVFSGMYFLGVDYPLVLGLLATLTEAIPIIGPIIGAIPGILLAYLASPVLATKVAAFYIIIHQIENHIVVPNIMGHTIDLHPILVIISLLIGGQLYGIVGMILAVPVAALLRVLLRRLWYFDEVNKDR
ncbi:AI-2E family transporter [Sporomusa carbonis]|uniref:AI-2E family transporter n=1 Tax=Sporomusa carbonis TaxID=3076075 RepID=UPI003C7EA4AB